VSRLGNWAWTVLVLLAGKVPRRQRRERIVPEGAPDRRAESLVILLLLAGALCAAGFVAVYALDRTPHQTQFLGLSIGLAFACLAAAAIVVGKRLVVNEEVAEEYPPARHEPEQEAIERIVEESGSRFTRKRLLLGAAGAAGGALGAALLAPVVSLGPAFDVDALAETPWRRGLTLVDEHGRPLRAEQITEAAFYTAFPQGADRETIGAPVLVIRLDPGELRLPDGRDGWAPRGILAYSKICTHAGCAINLYRAPLFRPADPRPAFVCPCHYSTFDPARGGAVIFGPAGRSLPQLPLEIDPSGRLRAAGNFSGPVGPSWWGVREWKART
jgi:ubiquinol-cytochrome c reductase iron-sulfur subunit